jgi:hypothetical protein
VGQSGPAVTEKTFDEYHLYTLEHSTTLHDRETRQVEMVRAAGIQSKAVYVYDGFKLDRNYQNWQFEAIRQQESYGLSYLEERLANHSIVISSRSTKEGKRPTP